MAASSVTYTFTNGTAANGSEVNVNFSDLVTYINNRNDATATWDRITVTNATLVPMIVNNSTGTQNIANFQDNGSNVLQVTNGGASIFTAVGTTSVPVTINNGSSTGSIFILQDNGSAVVTVLDGGNVGIGTATPTSKLQVVGLSAYANNTLAAAGGLTAGAFYRTGGDPDVVCVVH
jgi:hypothetical protein